MTGEKLIRASLRKFDQLQGALGCLLTVGILLNAALLDAVPLWVAAVTAALRITFFRLDRNRGKETGGTDGWSGTQN